MQNKRQNLYVLSVALLIAMAGTSCSREAKKSRHLKRASGYFQAEQYEKAEIEYLNVLRLDPQNPVAEQADDLVALARLSAIHERDGAFEKARDLYERALNKDLKNVLATLKLARLYADRFNNTKKALELAKTARELAPADGAVAHTLGRLAYQAGDFKW